MENTEVSNIVDVDAEKYLSDDEAQAKLGEMFRELKATLRVKSKRELVRVAAGLALELFKQRTINEAMQAIMDERNGDSAKSNDGGSVDSDKPATNASA